MIFSIIILLFPPSPAPDSNEMNYTIAVIGAWFAFCLAYFFVPVYGGTYWFEGPQITIENGGYGLTAGTARQDSRGASGFGIDTQQKQGSFGGDPNFLSYPE